MKVFSGFLAAVSAALLVSACSSDGSELRVEPLLSDGAVLQQNSTMELSGKAAPGTPVSVFADWDLMLSTTAGIDSVWSVNITTPRADKRRHTIMVESSSNSITYSDLLIGEVWLAIGHEEVNTTTDASDAVVSADSLVRFFEIENGTSPEPEQWVNGKWKVSSPANFNGIGQTSLSFISHLRDSLDIPVGIILASYSKAPCKSWVNVKAIDERARRNAEEEKYDEWEEMHEKCQTWLAEQNCLPLATTTSVYDDYVCVSNFDINELNKTQLPGQWGPSDLPGFDGIVWYFKEVPLPMSMAGKRLRFYTGRMGGRGVVYVNQTYVGHFDESNMSWTTCFFDIPAEVTRNNHLDLAIRITGKSRTGGLYGHADGSPIRIELVPTGDESADTAYANPVIGASGEWRYFAAARIEGDSVRTLGIPQNDFMRNFRTALAVPNTYCGSVFNKMIAPLRGKKVAGVVCNIGSADCADKASDVSYYLPLLAKSVRGVFDDENGALPFFFTQRGRIFLTDAQSLDVEFGDGVREAQMEAVVNIPNAKIVSTLDIAAVNGYKTSFSRMNEVGIRLSKVVLADVYGCHVFPAYDPTPVSATVRQQLINIKFDNSQGLCVNTALPTAFEIAGVDSVFYPARALAGENSLTVFSHMVTEPVYVRYAHYDSMEPTLWNAYGMPAPAFFFHAKREN